ncbi:MAG: QueT transporter family protein [Clostridium sp.]|nr:QueT transporter family protein [Clostridium sp.]
MEMRTESVKNKQLVISGLVIALYTVVMIVTQGFAFGAVQIRIATTLYALAYIFPFLVLPLGLANVLSNMLLGGLGAADIIGGGLVGILTSLLVYGVRKYKLNINLTAIPIVFIPGLIVPIWLCVILKIPYLPLAFSLCLGQVVPAALGTALIKILQKRIGE